MVIDETGKKLGILNTQEALKIAQEKNLDLVEVGPFQKPPIVKIMDFGKWLYQKEKASREKKKSKLELKIVRIRLATSKHDLEIKAKKVDEFLKRGNKAIIELQLKRRESALKNLAEEKIKNFLELIKEPKVIEKEQKFQQKISLIIRKK